ncbi:MAG: hypothetical protein HY897_18395 [Deltaproteobacteria bacterium]|nr:hypothetical protein [Deltaproteobacteria bacterium]
MRDVDLLIRSRYPILYLLTHEEGRLEHLLFDLANSQGKAFFTWTATAGLRKLSIADADLPAAPKGEFHDPAEVLGHIRSRDVAGIFMLKDFHPFRDDPQIVRLMRDMAIDLKGTYKNIILTAPRLNLPPELEKDVTLIDFPLPDAGELLDLLKSVCRTLVQKNPAAVNLQGADVRAIVQAALGLTLSEAENAFAKAAVTDGVIDKSDISIVLNEKKQIIRKSGILEFYPTESSMNDVGGLGVLKEWLRRRKTINLPT